MSRQQAIDSATAYFDQGTFQSTLARRVAIPTESQEPGKIPVLTSYLTEELAPTLKGLGFDCKIIPNPIEGGAPFMVAARGHAGIRIRRRY